MVMIDGLPIVSGLSTVYGFSDPQALIERIEIVKGPASTLLIWCRCGVINLITQLTKTAQNLP